MPMTDDLSRLASIVTRDLVLSGRARAIRQQTGLSLSELGKASGVTAELVGLWESGKAAPTTQQALAWLSLLTERASWREAAADAEATPAEVTPARPRRAQR